MFGRWLDKPEWSVVFDEEGIIVCLKSRSTLSELASDEMWKSDVMEEP